MLYKILPDADLKLVVKALRDAADCLEAAGSMDVPVGESSASHRDGPKPEKATKGRGREAQKVIDRVGRGGKAHKPRQFDKTGPRISDFVYLLMNSSEFAISEAREKIRRFVVLSNKNRDSAGQVRSALGRDTRFEKQPEGKWIKR